MATAEESIRSYLLALRDPAALRDEEAIATAREDLDAVDDPIDRLQRREELDALLAPSIHRAEDRFIMHAKAWADEVGVSATAFMAEGVSASVLRRAGFVVVGTGSARAPGSGRGSTRSGGRARPSPDGRRGRRVTTDEVVGAIPTTAFTTAQLQELAGASPAVTRKAITRELDAGRLVAEGPDPDHHGPGRAPTLYRRT